MATKTISASDLISALTNTVSAHCESNGWSSGCGSSVPSVPVGTPQEGLSGLAKLGIQPGDILNALSSLSLASMEEERGHSVPRDETTPSSGEESDIETDSIPLRIDHTISSADRMISRTPPGVSSPVASVTGRHHNSDPLKRKYTRIIDISVPNY